MGTRLIRWYQKKGRDLPWRNTTDPYPILVSEIMLQQTQVNRVKDFYTRWLDTFPDWKTLSQASPADVIRAWSGLGYNRRALALHAIAKEVVKKGVPINEDGWRSLKGIGPYTAAALTVFASKKRAYPVDTNIRRVVSRLFLHVPFAQIQNDTAVVDVMRTQLMNQKNFHDVPQALFDLATIHCTKIPDCANCPMRLSCTMADDFLRGHIETPKRMTGVAKEKKHRNKPYPDRIYRGRILKTVTQQGRLATKKLGPSIDPGYNAREDRAWVEAMVVRLVHDGLLVRSGVHVCLPKS